MGVTLKLTENVLNTYMQWHPQVLHDLHESVALSLRQHGRRRSLQRLDRSDPRRRVADDRLEQRLGDDEVRHARRVHPRQLRHLVAGLSDVHRRAATTASAGCTKRSATAARTLWNVRSSQRLCPHLVQSRIRRSEALWSQRNNNNYQQTGLLTSLHYFAANKQLFPAQTSTPKSKRSILKARTEGPAAYVFTADDPRPGAQADLLRTLQKQGVEISRATAPFTVTVPGKKAARSRRRRITAGRRGRIGRKVWADPMGRNGREGQEGQEGQDKKPAAPTTRTFPAGSYIVRMDQPYSRIADSCSTISTGARTIRSGRLTTHRLDLPELYKRADGPRD